MCDARSRQIAKIAEKELLIVVVVRGKSPIAERAFSNMGIE
jgi:hypothetical protein